MTYKNPLKSNQHHIDLLIRNPTPSVVWLWTRYMGIYANDQWKHLGEVMILASQALKEGGET